MSLVHLVIAGRDSGKTDFCKVHVIEPCVLPKNLIVDIFDNARWRTSEDYRHKFPELGIPAPPMYNIPIIDFDQVARQKSGTYRVFSSDIEALFELMGTAVSRTNAIYEDATRYFGKTLTKNQVKIILDSKQKHNHVTFVFHTLMSPPPELIKHSDLISFGRVAETKAPDKYDCYPGTQKVIDYLHNQPDPHKFITLRK